MVDRKILQAASTLQLKCWQFAIAERLKKQLCNGLGRYTPLWKIAKENVGSKSLVFGLERWERMYERRDMLGYSFIQACLGSLENSESRCKMYARRIQLLARTFIHDIQFKEDFEHMGMNTVKMKSDYNGITKKIMLEFYNSEDPVCLLIVADHLEDYDEATFEAEHLREGHHGLSCPVVLNILKGLI